MDVDYLREHGVAVENEAVANAAITSAIAAICAEGPADLGSHEAAHEAVHAVEDVLD